MATEKPEEIKLTDKQQRFVQEYCVDFNRTQAALRAGYSERTAYAIGSENLKKPQIRAAIDERMKELSLTADETLKGISDIARANLNEYFKVVKVQTAPRVKTPLAQIIERLKAQNEDADSFIIRAQLLNQEELDSEYLDDVAKKQKQRRLDIIRLEIELERNPEAYRIESGPEELIETVELDLPKLIRDKEAGKIKSVKHSEHGLNVELYPADAALRDLARIHGLFEKDNKQVKPESNVTIFQLPDNGRG
ncbi:terminase small subunit [Pontibacter sp. 172403-2]|uniref:terminase small subunit n=1 Tax=Pontibacter rufus TaxID=2791028 RepID=UPI0018AFAF23|nr:terminase small subunit [Pontibacter sp. 172403-2]MBF9252470.1 terminase small subunit [Pontibacter sp. 172403-2]